MLYRCLNGNYVKLSEISSISIFAGTNDGTKFWDVYVTLRGASDPVTVLTTSDEKVATSYRDVVASHVEYAGVAK